MADLPYINEAQEVKIVGQDATGNNVNFVTADASGNMNVVTTASGPVTPGAVAGKSNLSGGQFNTTLPTLTNTQQSAIQLDASGRQITTDAADGSVTPGTVASKSLLGGGQFNTTLPTLTNTQQAALQVDAAGRLITKPGTAGPVTPGTVATFSDLAGGQYNSTPPTLTNGQQAALQLDSAGKLLVTLPTIPTPAFTNKFRIEIDTTTKTLTSTTTYTTIYTYTGSGLFVGWSGEFAANRVDFRIIIDGTETIINSTSIILGGIAATASNAARWQNGSGVQASSGNLDISFRYPIKFNTSFLIEARLTSGANFNFSQGIMYIEKDT